MHHCPRLFLKREESGEGTSDEPSVGSQSPSSSAFSPGLPSLKFSLLKEVSFLNKSTMSSFMYVSVHARVCGHSYGERIPRVTDMLSLGRGGWSIVTAAPAVQNLA